MPRLIALALTLALAAPAGAVYEIGDPVADFTLADLDGVPRSLSDWEGDVILLNFFTTWCPGCNEEADDLQHVFWEGYRDRGVTVLAVDIAEPPILVDGWAQANEIDYPILVDPTWDTYQRFGNGIIPYNTVIDRDGILRYSQFGFDPSALTAVIDEILAADPTPARAGAWGRLKALY